VLGPGHIAVDPENVAATLRRIDANRSGVPAPSEVGRVVGTSAYVTGEFHDEITLAANTLSRVVSVVLHELEASHEAIRKTVEALIESDASNTDEAKTILAVLDSTVDAPTPAPAPVSPRTIDKSW